MAPPPHPRPLRKDYVSTHFKASKVITYSERPTSLVPNVHSVSWSPTGAMIAHAITQSIRVWNAERPDVRSSSELRDTSTGKVTAHAGHVDRVQFSPTHEALLASTGKDSMVKVWDVRLPGGGAVAGVSGGPVGGRAGTTNKAGEHALGDQGLFLTWHPNGQELLVGTHKDVVTALDVRKMDSAMLEVPTVTTGAASGSNLKYELIPTIRTPPKDENAKYQFNQMAFSNSGRELLCTTTEGRVCIFSYPELTLLHTLRAHASCTYCIEQSPTGHHIAVGSSDSLVTLWDTTTWTCNSVLTGQTTGVRDVSFSFDGAYLCAGALTDGKGEPNEKGLRIYHVDTGEEVHTVDTNHTVRDVAWHPLRHAIAYSGDPGGVKVVGGLG